MGERDEWLQRIGSIRQWNRNGERAPHKPLLILTALAQLQQTGSSTLRFADAEPKLAQLLTEFGSPHTKPTPEYPFNRLQNDGLWVVDAGGIEVGEVKSKLRATNAAGSFTPDLEGALRDDPALGALVALDLLFDNWPETQHADICRALGLDIEAFEDAAVRANAKKLRRRDPEFRRLVLVAYEYQCAICGYDGRLGSEAVGLDAAHVRWWAFDGPDDIGNGLCLCSLHHKLLDRGVIGLTPDGRVAVSQHFVGRGRAADDLVYRFVDEALTPPQPGHELPRAEHVAWHADQVFRGPARQAA
ncbi:MAG: HNH endonuclease [Acidimicrobiia bacterium]